MLGPLTAVAVWLFNQAIGVVRAVTINPQSAGDRDDPGRRWQAAASPSHRSCTFHRPTRAGSAHHRRCDRTRRSAWRNAPASALGDRSGDAASVWVCQWALTGQPMIGGHLASLVRHAFSPTWSVCSLAGRCRCWRALRPPTSLSRAVFFALEVVLGGFGGAVCGANHDWVATALGLTICFWAALRCSIASPGGTCGPNATLLLYVVAVVAAPAAIAYVNMPPRSNGLLITVCRCFWGQDGLYGPDNWRHR